MGALKTNHVLLRRKQSPDSMNQQDVLPRETSCTTITRYDKVDHSAGTRTYRCTCTMINHIQILIACPGTCSHVRQQSNTIDPIPQIKNSIHKSHKSAQSDNQTLVRRCPCPILYSTTVGRWALGNHLQGR